MKFLFFSFTIIILIIGCGSSSSGLQTLTSKEAKQGSVFIAKNLSTSELVKFKEEIIESSTKLGAQIKEFSYSTSVSCLALGYERSGPSPEAVSYQATPSRYHDLKSKSLCIELDFSSTSTFGMAGSEGFVLLATQK